MSFAVRVQEFPFGGHVGVELLGKYMNAHV